MNEMTKTECDELVDMCKDLLKGADMLTDPPYYIVQPFMDIVRKHVDLINKFNLMEKCTKRRSELDFFNLKKSTKEV